MTKKTVHRFYITHFAKQLSNILTETLNVEFKVHKVMGTPCGLAL
ncbi:hypothetical protein X975_20380, partial [Stegodyphus mimosarum]